MDIICKDIAKKFNDKTIFSNLNLNIQKGSKYGFLGPNGSGKSTALLSIAGYYQLSSGSIAYIQNQKQIDESNKFSFISIASPYLDLQENFTAKEIFYFQSKFKPFISGLNEDNFFKKINLNNAKDTPVKFFSSGMKQILKLGLAIFCDTPILFLDEPCSNLDSANILIFREIYKEFAGSKTVLIGTNDHPSEVDLVQTHINILQYKK